MKLPSKLSINTISKKLPTLSDDQLAQLSSSISVSPQNVVSIDTKKILNQSLDKSFSIRLKKWIEPYKVAGVDYSLFYTEVDHNYKVGNRVFIEGGNYDSDNYIKLNGYKKGVDGYKVIYVDRCKIVLNIPYTGVFPTNEEGVDNFVKVYVASTQEEFDYYCQVLSMREDGGVIKNKFDVGMNNLLYLNGTFSIPFQFPYFYNLSSFMDSTSFITPQQFGNSFVYRHPYLSDNVFRDTTSDVLTNSFTSILNVDYADPLSGFYNNGKIKIMNGNFESGGVRFKNGYIYYFDTTDSIWKIDKTYLPVIITEQHFKGGVFKGGEFNQGLYGQHENRIEYSGDNIKWNLGTVLNTTWKSGVLDSTVFRPESYFTIFDRYELPQIRANAENNGGAGYNYVFDTDFVGGDVINGNIFNMAVIYGTNSLASSLEDYVTGTSTTYSVSLSGGVYYNSDILFATVSNSTFISSYIFNSVVQKCKSVNSEFESSVFLDSTWISDKIVKIQNYEESNIDWYDENSNIISYKMYKFYMTDTNFERLRDFQNFYFQDMVINLPSSELLNFFDDKFTIGQYLQTYDVPGSKPERRVLCQLSTKEENRNSPGIVSIGGTSSMIPNDVALPSLDIFIYPGDNFNYDVSASYPRPFIADTIDISKAYILDSDFISGLFKDSKWVTGNYINYNYDYSFIQNGVYSTASLIPSTKEIKLSTGLKKRKEILGTSSVSDIVFLNGLHYDTTLNILNPGTNLVQMPDTYKITDVVVNGGGWREFKLQDVATSSIISNLPAFADKKYFKTKNAQNKYNYLHPVKFENSIISSGIFRRAYFENCDIFNNDFDIKDRDLRDVPNKRKLLLSDIIFDNNSNVIKSGIVQYSSFVNGNDVWDNGIFHQGIWNKSLFTYSYGATSSSTTLTRVDGNFKNGIFRNSRWVNGTFENGLFYKNASNTPGTPTVYSGTMSAYYIDGNLTKWSWMDGKFKNGDFEQSNFEKGLFEKGNFYDSTFLTGEAIGGNFGKDNVEFSRSRIYTGTFSNVTAINAEFRTADPTGAVPSLFSPKNIQWNSGIFNNGVFGVKISGNVLGLLYPFKSKWVDGIFNGGEFGDVASWENGTFNGGKFTSYFGKFFGIVKTPKQLSLESNALFSWKNGKFNGGEFGTGLTSSDNSTWYTGEFNGGLFKGRYWKNGVFTRGTFEGHAKNVDDYIDYDGISATYSTDINTTNPNTSVDSINHHNQFLLSYNSFYYGFWQDGFVTRNKDKFITDEKLYTDVERESTKKRKSKESTFKNMMWYSGTFSNFDAEMRNSIWLDGDFQDGYFNKSAFNPYINLIDPLIFQSFGSNGIYNVTTPLTITQSYTLQPGEVYTLMVDVSSNTSTTLGVYTTSLVNIVPSGAVGILSGTFSINPLDIITSLTIRIGGTGNITFSNMVLYPGTQSGFRISDSCIWENGYAFDSDFYLSKWNQGTFDSYASSKQGNAWGLIWKDGITKYMNAFNVFWEDGVWKNGNWFGSPFTQIATHSGVIVYPGFSSDIINNISLYASQSYATSSDVIYSNWDNLHMNDTFTFSNETQVLADPDLVNNFSDPARSVDTQSPHPWIHSTNDLVYYLPFFVFSGNFDFYLSYYGDSNSVYTNTLNSRLYAYDGSRNVFDNDKMYEIEIEYYGVFNNAIGGSFGIGDISGLPLPVGWTTNLFPAATQTVEFQVRIGYNSGFLNGGSLQTISNTFPLYNYGSPQPIIGHYKFGSTGKKTARFSFRPSNLNQSVSGSQELIIRKLGTSDVRLYISKISIVEKDAIYDPVTNNELSLITQFPPAIGSTVSLPTNILYNLGGVSSRFGNGQFTAGIWENGIWNEGWRDDFTQLKSDKISNFSNDPNNPSKNLSYQTDTWTWEFDLNILDTSSIASNGLIDDFSIGDKVSVGNIVTIDINGERRLLRGYLTVVDILTNQPGSLSSGVITLQFNINFPIRSVEKDSDSHLITISRNVWLNGAFLNGKFLNGVWNNGLFQGYPYITEMEDSHWIDGKFKGGRFAGFTYSYLSPDSSDVEEKHTSVIQKFDFSDENVSGQPYSFRYNSWIDVNYFQTSGVNLNRVNDVYKQTSLGFTTSFVENNFYGYPTVDVLDSNSTLRNGFDLDSRNYRLGWKHKEYTNFLDEVGEFIDINEANYVNNESVSPVGLGLSNFFNDGWTYSYQSNNIPVLGLDGFAVALNSIQSNIGNLTSEWLYLSGGKNYQSVTPYSDNSNFNVDIFDNDYASDIEKLRYSFIEIESDNLNFSVPTNGIPNPIVFYNNYPSTYSIAANFTLFNGSNITIPIPQIMTSSVVSQREYFFNKNNLEMLIFSGSTYSLRFKKIRKVETDMVPFLQIADDCIKFKTIVTWVSWNISWQNSGIPPQGTIIPIPGQGLPFWSNFYLVGSGNSCVSYINENIQVPYVAIAPDIDYGNSGFNYISSINVTIPTSNINTETTTSGSLPTGGTNVINQLSQIPVQFVPGITLGR